MGNYLFDIIAIAVSILLIVVFACKGFVKSIFRFFRWLFAALMAYLFGNRVASFLFEKLFYKAILKSITEKVQAAYSGATAGYSGATAYEKLPFFLKTEAMKTKLYAIESGDEAVANISEAISKPVASIASNIAGYLLVFLVAFLLFLLLTIVLDKVVKLSSLTKFINGFLGALVGAILSLLLIVMAVSVVKIFFSDMPVYEHSFLVRWIGNSKLLQGIHIFNIGERWLSGMISS